MSNTAPSDNRIYLDYAAATPIDARVLSAMLPYFDARYGNASSLHTSGRKARGAIEAARAAAARVIHASPEEIIFTGSGTESDNMALLGVARANRARGNHILISAIEHKAVIEAAEELRKEGFEVETVPADEYGIVSVEECMRRVTDKTILISIMYANNEIGTIEPIKELAAAIHAYRGGSPYPFLHTDACPAAGFLTLDVTKLGVDLMTLNGSKIYGPKGVGLLYKRSTVSIRALIVGGEQEKNLRAGTESVPVIVGFAEALKIADAMREEESSRLSALRDYFIAELLEKIPSAILNGHPRERLPNNASITVPFVEGESMLLLLDRAGIEVSTGSACSAFDLRPSHVLLAIGHDPELVHGSVRFSLGRNTTKAGLERVLSVFPEIVQNLTRISALTAHV
ncbi:cysteine desulfurase [Candidatus Kaiserbacteria bacterium]|nr:cysteine desulfurase [Candidatus Kaiserbacteria bacterium]